MLKSWIKKWNTTTNESINIIEKIHNKFIVSNRFLSLNVTLSLGGLIKNL